MSSEISIPELQHLVYISDHLLYLRLLETEIKTRVISSFPKGTTRVETDAGVILVHVPFSGEDASQVSVRYEDG